MKVSYLSYEESPHYFKIISKGEWTLQSIRQIGKRLRKISTHKKIVWDVSHVTKFDSAGILLFMEYFERFEKYTEVEVVGYTQKQKELFVLLKNTDDTLPIHSEKEGYLESLGKKVIDIFSDIIAYITFLGHLFYATVQLIFHPYHIRFKEMVYHVNHSGVNALVIIGLTSFLVGMVIAYQGSVQLSKFGADIFIVDTVGLSITRELGPMITAIVIAGRSGSAYTAEIGAMKITEEIAAMRTMGFDPYYFLVLPRLFGLMISLPLLIFFSDIMGIAGGMLAAKMQLGISPTQFIERLNEVLGVTQYYLGMLKGPFFAFVIATIGCFRGFQVSNNTESIGLQTTASVVNSIFMVIFLDALFSVIYTELGFDIL